MIGLGCAQMGWDQVRTKLRECLTIRDHVGKISPHFESQTLQAEIAQLVEHATENCGVVSSILTLGTLWPAQ